MESCPTTDTASVDFNALWNEKHAPRPAQAKLLGWLGENHADINIIQAPTGVGKSMICSTVARDGGGIILTPQISLQEQYLADFPDLALIKSASNYECPKMKAKSSGAVRDCKNGASLCRGEDKQNCPYVIAKNAFIDSPRGTSNYAYFLRAIGVEDFALALKQRWLILDEAHNLGGALIDAMSMEFSKEFCEDVGINYLHPSNIKSAWANFMIMFLELESRRLVLATEAEDTKNSAKPDPSILQRLQKAEAVCEKALHIKFLYQEFMDGDDESEVVVIIDHEKHKVTYRPLYESTLWNMFVEPLKKKILLTSATFLNVPYVRKSFGWSEEKCVSASVKSPFAKENRKVMYRPAVPRLNFNNMKEEFPKVIKAMDGVLDNMPYKGVVHCHSFAQGRWIKEQSKHRKRLLVHEPGEDRDMLIKEYLGSDPKRQTVLVSPSVTEGLDLKGDLGRFAIFTKVPYPSMGDPWCKRRGEVDSDWYDYQVAKTIVQGAGRVCRSEDDWGMTWILDGSFEGFHQRAGKFFPKWFTEAFM